ncbi:MAG: Ig-like domain-containing protein [Planctomycetota bacterium]|jgi:hypothetical protein
MKRRLVVFSVLAILSVIVLVIILVSTANNPPNAESSSVTTQEGTPVSITLVGSDPDGDSLSYSVVTEPSHGSFSGTEPNLTYSPGSNYNGPDSFTFKVNDGTSDSAVGTVLITVTSVNDQPKANDDSVTAQEDAPIVTIDVLANDTDPDNDRLMVINATQGSNGSVTINTDKTLTYAPNRNFCGADKFTYTVSDGKGQTDRAAVNVTVKPINDAPAITSKPVTTTRVWDSYNYDVSAKDPDTEDKLTYWLTTKPEGMSIDTANGLIEWRPTSAQAGTYDVLVRVTDSNSVPAWDTQEFAVTVTSLDSPLTNTLTVAECYNQTSTKALSAEDKSTVVQASDDNRWETGAGSYTSYDFCDASIPSGAKIMSVVVYVEHFEEQQFPQGKLIWYAGTGWPAKSVVWASATAPVRLGQENEATDSWDITSSVETPEKVNSLQLQVKNIINAAQIKTSADYIYAVVKWY